MENAKIVGPLLCTILVAAATASAQRSVGVMIDPVLLQPRCHATVYTPVRGAHGSAVPADYDGDERVDFAEKRDDGEWSIDYASNGFGAWDETRTGFGPAYFTPVPGDYDGDRMADLSTKDSDGAWYIDFANDGFREWNLIVYGYGNGSVRPVPADYDGDCKVDLAIVDTAGTWYIDYAADGFTGWNAIYPNYGTNIVPVPADYDGDGRVDIAVKDNGSGHWIIDFASNGFGHWDVSYPGFGGLEFAPVPADFDGDGRTDLASRDTWDDWYVDYAGNGLGSWDVIVAGYGASQTYHPVTADFDGDHKADLVSHTDAGDWLLDVAANGFGVWDQYWNSYATVDATRSVTAADLLKFDSKTMQPYQLGGELWGAEAGLKARANRGVWVVVDRVEAMLRMYEVTRQRRFLDEASAFIDLELKYRDDQHPDGPMLDEVRGVAGLPGWGGRGLDHANLYLIDETVSNLYLHPFAVFARIVAEDPDPLIAEVYGERAIRYADAAVQTIGMFLPQIRFRTVNGNLESYLALPPNIGPALQGGALCDEAAAQDHQVPDGEDRDQLISNCHGYALGGGYPMAHNEQHLFLMNLIDLSRVLDSAYYKAHSPNSANEENDRVLYPLLVGYGYRFFRRHLDYTNVPDLPYRWNHADDGPVAGGRPDDASHAVETARYVVILNRDLARLNARIAPAGGPTIAFGAADLRHFASTFLLMSQSGHIADNVAGTPHDPVDELDFACDGWLGLAGVEPKIFDRCRDMLLRVVDGTQKNLSLSNYASLLAAKALRYPAPPRNPILPRRTTALVN